jgi:hypothetical protein
MDKKQELNFPHNPANGSPEQSSVEKSADSILRNKNPKEQREEKLLQINTELQSFNSRARSDQEVKDIEKSRNDEYQQKKAQLESDLGPLSAESEGLIHRNMVADVVDAAYKENNRFNFLQNEKKKLILYNNLDLGKNSEAAIIKSRKAIEDQDPNGEKMKIFNKALEYYSKPLKKIADVPIYHGTGSGSLYKIFEKGMLDSSKNIFGGEKGVTGKSHGGTSFAIGGYGQSEMVGHLYARMNERKSRLIVDSKSIFGNNIASGKEMMEVIHQELPKLKPEERRFVEEKLKSVNTEDVINLFDNEKYYFDYDAISNELQELKDKLEGKQGEITDEDYKEYLQKRIPYLENQIEGYDKMSDEEKEILKNPFGVVLVYDGGELPKKDLETFTTAGICERRTKEPIRNSKIKQIHAPHSEMAQINDWIKKRIQILPEDSEERKALENVEIIPLEYFETKSIIKNINSI